MLTNVDSLGAGTSQNEPHNYFCERCDYSTSKVGNWQRHLKTKKHNVDSMLTDVDSLGAETSQNEPLKWQCKCGKNYSYKQSYYRHKKTCAYKPSEPAVKTQNEIVAQGIDKDVVILELLKRIEQKDKLMEEKDEIMEQLDKMMGDLIHRVGNHNMTDSQNTNIILQLDSNYPNALPGEKMKTHVIDAIGNDTIS